jgi:hypothetical protein
MCNDGRNNGAVRASVLPFLLVVFVAGFLFLLENDLHGLHRPETYWKLRFTVGSVQLSVLLCLLVLSWACDGSLGRIGLTRNTAIRGSAWGMGAALLVLLGRLFLAPALLNLGALLPQDWQNTVVPRFLSWEVSHWYPLHPVDATLLLWRELVWVLSEDLFLCFVVSRAAAIFRSPYVSWSLSTVFLAVLHWFYGWEQLNLAATLYFSLSIAGRAWLFLKTRSLLAPVIPHYAGNLLFLAAYGATTGVDFQ